MKPFFAMFIAICLGLAIGFICKAFNFHGYYAGFLVGSVTQMSLFALLSIKEY